MPHYLIRYKQTGDPQQREVMRDQHIAYRRSVGLALTMSGPLLGDDGKPVGSVIIYEAETKADAEAFANGDPFVKTGLLALDSIEAMGIASMKQPA